MVKLNKDDLKALALEVLCEIRDICRKNGIAYSLTGGTLIGAVRHGGFIPWDDDIDIMMPRPDYDRFIELVRSGGKCFNLYSYESCGDDYWYPFAKACRKNTKIVEKSIVDSNITLGVYVDIFPIDGAGNSFFGAKLRCKLFKILHGLKLTKNWTCYRRSKIRSWYYEPLRFACYLIGKLFSKHFLNKMLDKFLRAKPYDKCAYAGRMSGDYGSREIMKKYLFDTKTTVVFEGEEFDAVADYDSFLRSLYGDYTVLPPEHKRVTHHDFEVYWVD